MLALTPKSQKNFSQFKNILHHCHNCPKNECIRIYTYNTLQLEDDVWVFDRIQNCKLRNINIDTSLQFQTRFI